MAHWKPEGYPSMSPYLICDNAESVIAFIEHVFGGVLLRRFDRDDGSLMHAEVRIDDSVLMIGGSSAEGAAPHIHVYVSDAKAVFERATAYGATVVQDPIRNRNDDDLRGGVCDPSGTTWWIASQ